MKFYKISQLLPLSDSTNIKGLYPPVDWNASDNYGIWNKQSVAEFLNITPDEFIYETFVDIDFLNPQVVEYEDAKNIRNKNDPELKEEAKELYYEDAKSILDQYNESETYNPDLNHEWGDFLVWDYDEDDVMDIAMEMMARNTEDWDKEGFNSQIGKFPPIVATRNKNGDFTINDGNHRVSIWKEAGYQFAPAWINDELKRFKKY